MKQIIIQPSNPHDITVEDAEELAQAIRDSYPKYDVRVESNEQLGTGVTLYEVLRIWLLTTVGQVIIQEITKSAIAWARQRFKKKGESIRTTYIAIYGPNGEVLKTVVVKNAIDKPEDRTTEDREHGMIWRNGKATFITDTPHEGLWKRVYGRWCRGR